MYPYQNYYPQYYPQQQFQNYQAQQIQPQIQSVFNGKVINRLEDISANDVPMDGSRAYFPLADNSRIIVKNWLANGTIQTQLYEPVNVESGLGGQNINETNAIDLSAITERLDDIENMIRELQPKKNLMKKEVTQND